MKQVYGKIKPISGAHIGGVIKVIVAPKDWLLHPIDLYFITGTVYDPTVDQAIIKVPQLIDGYNWQILEFVDESYDFNEKPKAGKAGAYNESSLTGIVNYLDPDFLQILESYKFCELVVIATDRNKRRRIIGNKDKGMAFQFSTRNQNNAGGTLNVSIEMGIQTEAAAPFYFS